MALIKTKCQIIRKKWQDFNFGMIFVGNFLKKIMFRLDLLRFYEMFPNYVDYRIPMWSEYKETDDKLTVKVVVPGFEKEDFVLYVEGNRLFLDIKNKKDKTTYSVLQKLLNETYLLDKANAEYTAGILKITIPKDKPVRKTLSIAIK